MPKRKVCLPFQSTKLPLSTNAKKSRACSRVPINIFKDQKPTNFLFGSDSTLCVARKTSCGYEKEKQSTNLKKFFRQSQSSSPEPEPKNSKIFPFMAKLCRCHIG